VRRYAISLTMGLLSAASMAAVTVIWPAVPVKAQVAPVGPPVTPTPAPVTGPPTFCIGDLAGWNIQLPPNQGIEVNQPPVGGQNWYWLWTWTWGYIYSCSTGQEPDCLICWGTEVDYYSPTAKMWIVAAGGAATDSFNGSCGDSNSVTLSTSYGYQYLPGTLMRITWWMEAPTSPSGECAPFQNGVQEYVYNWTIPN
jgi:hypothetical protein